jgi:hypothetical protein
MADDPEIDGKIGGPTPSPQRQRKIIHVGMFAASTPTVAAHPATDPFRPPLGSARYGLKISHMR